MLLGIIRQLIEFKFVVEESKRGEQNIAITWDMSSSSLNYPKVRMQ